ncbi:hypothetical protein [Oerskovia turbata]
MSGDDRAPRPPARFPQTARPPGPRSPRAAAVRTRRLRRRALLLLVPLPVLVVALALGAKLALLPLLASSAADRNAAGAHASAAEIFGLQKTANVVEPWKAWFNTGTATHEAGDDPTAISDLHRAYDLARDEAPMVRCRVQINLSIAYETSGDEDTIMGDDYLAQKQALEEALAARAAGEDYDAFAIDPFGTGEDLDPQDLQDDAATWHSFAERSYATAEQVRGWPGCEEQPPEEKERNEQSVERLRAKQQQAKDAQQQEAAEAPESEQPQPEAGQSEQERAEAERQDRLEQQNSEARDDEERTRQEYQDYFGGDAPADGSAGSPKNW